MFNATKPKNMIEQDDRAGYGSLDHGRYCTAKDDRAEISIIRVTYAGFDHRHFLIEQNDREKTHFFDHNTVPLVGRGLIEQGAGPNTPPIRRLGAETIPRPVAIPIRPVWFTASLAAPAHMRASSGPVGRRIPASPSPRIFNPSWPPFPSGRRARRADIVPLCRLNPSAAPHGAGDQFPRREYLSRIVHRAHFPKSFSITGPDRRTSILAA